MPSCNPALIHKLWFLVDHNIVYLRSLDDVSLVRWLLQQLSQESYLTPEALLQLEQYIHDRRCLIRDLLEPQTANNTIRTTFHAFKSTAV